MSTTRKSVAKKKPPRPPSDRNQGRKTLDPSGEVMTKRNVRFLDRHWEALQRRGHPALRAWLDMTDAQFDEYVAWHARLLRKAARAAA